MNEYKLYILPTDDTPWLVVPESAVNLGKPPQTIDVRWPECTGEMNDPRGRVVLRFRPTSPSSRVCYLVAMEADYTDGYLARYERSL